MTLRDAPGLLLGLIGSGIEASRAPALHEGEAAEQGLRCIYKLIDITKLEWAPMHCPSCWLLPNAWVLLG